GADPRLSADDVPRVGGERGVLTQGYERRIVEQYLLDAVEDGLLRRVGWSVEPFLGQRLDLGFVVPAGPALFAQAANEEIQGWRGHRDHGRGGVIQAPAAFFHRAAIGGALDHGAPVRRLEVDVQAQAAQQVAADLAERVVVVDVRGDQQNDLLPLVAGLGDRPFRGGQVFGHRHRGGAARFRDVWPAA